MAAKKRSYKVSPKGGAQLAGFTLFELLVVMLIISIVLGMAGLSSGQNSARKEKQMLHDVQQQWAWAKDRAMLQGESLALEVSAEGYRFVRWLGKDRWQALKDTALPGGKWPPASHIELEINHEPYGLAVANDKEAVAPARILLLPSGEMMPFVLTLHGAEQDYRLQGDLLGHVVLQQPASAGGSAPRFGRGS